MALIGPGATAQADTDVRPLLEGASEFEFIELLNPLSDDFAIQVAQDVPVNAPMNVGRDINGRMFSESELSQSYGLTKNRDFQAKKHISNSVIIKSGQTLRLKGSEAQVAIRQLVDEIMQREGNTRLMPDPNLRREVEERVIIRRGSIQELMDNAFTSPRQQATEAINQSNEVEDESVEFPDLERPVREDASGGGDAGTDDSAPQKRSPGRPKKA